MPFLVVLALVGFGAQMVNGSLGMGFGVISTTFLLTVGTTPAIASAIVQLAHVGGAAAVGLSHWRFGNVDWAVVSRIALPGGVGAFCGATFLSSLDTSTAAAFMSAILFVLGCYILIRFTLWGTPRGQLGKPLRRRFLAPLGLVGGFLNASGGGGWGPVATSALLASGRLEPRKTVGTVDAAEFVVVLAGSIGFVLGLGFDALELGWIVALLAGGVVAAPAAAWLTRHVPGRILGSLVGGLIVVTNVRLIVGTAGTDAPGTLQTVVTLVVLVVWAVAVAWSWRAHRAERATPHTPVEPARLAAGSPEPPERDH